MTKVGEPFRVEDDVQITFTGEGRARFRLQHTRDNDGLPDALSWCDVSPMSNRVLNPSRIVRKDDEGHMTAIGGNTLVDFVDGETVVAYRRFTADWLRVIPFDDADKEGVERCKAYSISIQPLVTT